MDEERSAREGQHLRLVDPQHGAEGADAADAGAPEDERSAEVAEEPILWRGQASRLLAVWPCTRAVLLLLVALVSTHGWAPWRWGPGAGTEGALAWISDGRLWSLLVLGWCAWAVLEVGSESYVLTPTHLSLSKGFRVRRTWEVEVHRLLNVSLEEFWPLRWLGLVDVCATFENVSIGCAHCQRPYTATYRLRAVSGGAALRQTLHRARARFQ